MACHERRVDATSEGKRIDAFVHRFLPELGPNELRSVFEHRDVKLDGKRVKADVRVHEGQLVQVYCMEQQAPALQIIFEDEDVLIVNKPAGISTVPDIPGDISLT